MSNFKLVKTSSGVLFEKNEKNFAVTKGRDGDIWFETQDSNLSMDINFNSRDRREWNSYQLFENLLQHIIGRFILSGDVLGEYPISYIDFIDFDNRIVTWHSDGGVNNVLKLHYDENNITVEIIKDINSNDNVTNGVRIRTSGSQYGTYYQLFEDFYSDVCSLEMHVNPKETVSNQKKKTIFSSFKGRK